MGGVKLFKSKCPVPGVTDRTWSKPGYGVWLVGLILCGGGKTIIAGVTSPEFLEVVRLPKDGLTEGGASSLFAEVSLIHMAGKKTLFWLWSLWSFPKAAQASLTLDIADMPPDSTLG